MNTQHHPTDLLPDLGLVDRIYWAEVAQKLAWPVLNALAHRQLRQTMPVEAQNPSYNAQFTHLEALGRLLCGIAPWLESRSTLGNAYDHLQLSKPMQPSVDHEVAHCNELAELAREAIDAGTDPASPDFFNFTQGNQPLVDAAFLAHALMRAPTELWGKLEPRVQKNLIAAFRATRVIKPGMNNWLLFSATIEAAMIRFGQQWESQPIQTAIDHHQQWYVGDGTYGDGPHFRWDFYNSFVIQPMLIDVLEVVKDLRPEWHELYPKVVARAKRYAQVQERLITPDGSYPPIGRSICYRFGAFQLLAQMALRNQLPDTITPAQVRCAMTAVIHRQFDAPNTRDTQGFLRPGLVGYQPSLAERYISTGSLYLCAAGLLPLGLPPDNPFWQGQADWTSKKIWAGQDISADHGAD